MYRSDKIYEMEDGFKTAFVDQSHQSNLAYRPEFLSNNYRKGKKVLVSIEQELTNCDEFIISVAFITKSGITPLLQTLKELEIKNIPGKILTTDYFAFSEPEALEKLNALKNIELRMFMADDETGGFHTKGYIFRQDETFRIIIGSSNMTLSAVTKNREWNTKFVSTDQGEITKEILSEFDDLWNDKNTLVFNDFIDEYRTKYVREKLIREQKIIIKKEPYPNIEDFRLEPNKMQVEFVRNLLELKNSNETKGLLASATGTGKTMAAAFAMRELNPKKILFLVHREQIAKQAKKSFMRIFGSKKTYGLLSGSFRELDADFLFSTMQMMAKPEILAEFDQSEFDIIILDECHHSGSESYQRIMSYFNPKFWLGMTASPDTNNYDIYQIFDHNIVYEIRLEQALEEDLLCPFHYFGITDLEINGQVFDDSTGLKNFSSLVSEDRAEYVIEKAEYFGHTSDRVKGLMFCSRKEEARELSERFNAIKKPDGSYYRTEVLTGEDSQSRREEVIDRLVKDDDRFNSLDYILTVDIFNEGVDIPDINQVIMLRPTESPVVFIQQLGRGLRKAEGKEYVVILDFIGNYTNNFMIPIALSGDRSYNKDTIRKYVREGSRIIPGSSTIHFDEVSKKRIYASIDSAKTNDSKLIKESYQTLKYKVGRIPTILEFKKYGSIDITKIFEKFGSYHNFLKKYEKDYEVTLNNEEELIEEFLSKKLVLFKRIHEVAVLRELITYNKSTVNIKEVLNDKYGIIIDDIIEKSVVSNLRNEFAKEDEKIKYHNAVFIENEGKDTFRLSDSLRKTLENPEVLSTVKQLIRFGIERNKEDFGNNYRKTSFNLYQKYKYEDVCRLLGWKRNMNAQNIGGYFYDSYTKTLPVFINYDKEEDAIAYEDRFLSESIFVALSKHPRKVNSTDADHIYKRKEEDNDNRIYLFVRKNKDDNEAKEFYFLGEVYAQGEPKGITMAKTKDDAFEITYKLDVPVRSDIYDYIVSD